MLVLEEIQYDTISHISGRSESGKSSYVFGYLRPGILAVVPASYSSEYAIIVIPVYPSLSFQIDDIVRQTQKRNDEMKSIKGQIAELTRYAQHVNGEIEALKNQVRCQSLDRITSLNQKYS